MINEEYIDINVPEKDMFMEKLMPFMHAVKQYNDLQRYGDWPEKKEIIFQARFIDFLNPDNLKIRIVAKADRSPLYVYNFIKAADEGWGKFYSYINYHVINSLTQIAFFTLYDGRIKDDQGSTL